MLTLAATNTLQAVAGTATAVTMTVEGMEYASSVETYKVLSQGQLPTSVAAQYTVPAATTAFIKMILLANTTGSLVSGIILYINGTAAANQITPSFSLPANGFATFDTSGWKVYDNLGNQFTSGTNIFDSTVPSDTTPLADSTTGLAVVAARRDHTHQSPGGVASIVAATGAIANTETVVASAIIPANLMQVGTTFRIVAAGVGTTSTSPGSYTFRVRIGTTTLTGNIAASAVIPATASVSAQAMFLEAVVTIRANGASGSALGSFLVAGGSTTTGLFTISATASQVAATVVVDTTAQKLIELTLVSGAASASITFHNALIEIVKM